MRRAAVSVPSNIAEGKDVILTRTLSTFCIKPADRYSSWRHNYRLPVNWNRSTNLYLKA